MPIPGSAVCNRARRRTASSLTVAVMGSPVGSANKGAPGAMPAPNTQVRRQPEAQNPLSGLGGINQPPEMPGAGYQPAPSGPMPSLGSIQQEFAGMAPARAAPMPAPVYNQGPGGVNFGDPRGAALSAARSNGTGAYAPGASYGRPVAPTPAPQPQYAQYPQPQITPQQQLSNALMGPYARRRR